MVVSSLVSLAFGWRTIGRAFSGLAPRRRTAREDPLAAIEVPSSWFFGLFLVGMVGVVAMQRLVWDIPVPMGILAVLLTFVLSVVACRATGETDTTPTGALGKVTQLTYGVLAPSNMTANIMTASVTANASGCAADLLTDLKSGYLLGANPRQQFLAQLAGILPGALVVGLAWSRARAERVGARRRALPGLDGGGLEGRGRAALAGPGIAAPDRAHGRARRRRAGARCCRSSRRRSRGRRPGSPHPWASASPS